MRERFKKFMSSEELVQLTRRKKYTEDEFWEMLSALDRKKWENLSFPQLPIEDLPTKAAENFVTPQDAPIPDCLSCGACCTFFFAIGVGTKEQTPDEKVWDVVFKLNDDTEIVVDRYLQRDAETLFCASLDTISSEKKVCQIYEQRPQACRKFEAGSDKCHALRRIYGFESALTLAEMYQAMQILKQRESKPNAPQNIREVKFSAQTDSDKITITALLNDGSSQVLHEFMPNGESWRQFEFCGMTINEAKSVIAEKIGQI